MGFVYRSYLNNLLDSTAKCNTRKWLEVRCASIGTLTTTLELHEMGYTHLTKEERYQIYAMQKTQSSIREMAEVLNRAPSTVSRELRRNRGQRGYRPGQ